MIVGFPIASVSYIDINVDFKSLLYLLINGVIGINFLLNI